MTRLSKDTRLALAQHRIIKVLGTHSIANPRTLEQKISDAGPGGQRVDPHVLTAARKELISEQRVVPYKAAGGNWFHLPDCPRPTLRKRLDEQMDVWKAIHKGIFGELLGQALEIATFRALSLLPSSIPFYGQYLDLQSHDDNKRYSKIEPPNHIGRLSAPDDMRLDFLVHHPDAGHLGIECKNVRQWLYPHTSEIKDMLIKCTALNCVPVLIARRIPYVTFRLLWSCGCIIHQTYNQLYPKSAASLAEKARHKKLLGYHDIRLGNQPDARLKKFITQHLLSVSAEARKRFDANKDLLEEFAVEEITYQSFAARVRRRESGVDEDFDEKDPDLLDAAD